MNEIWTTVVGNVVTEPKFWHTEAGVPMIRFRLASTPGNYEQGQWVDRATTYLTVTCFRHVANNTASSIQKGQPILAHGKLSVRAYTTADGRTDHETQVEATALGHNLARGITSFHRPAKSGPAAPGVADTEEWPAAGVEPAEAQIGISAHPVALGEPEDMLSAGLDSEFGAPERQRAEAVEVGAA